VTVDPANLDWAKGDGLLPAIVQDARTGTVLMLGFMNREALETTLRERRATFYSRTRQRCVPVAASRATTCPSLAPTTTRSAPADGPAASGSLVSVRHCERPLVASNACTAPPWPAS